LARGEKKVKAVGRGLRKKGKGEAGSGNEREYSFEWRNVKEDK